MIPILFEQDTTNFNTNGICRLADAISCEVTEVQNKSYTLEMRYPLSGKHFKEIKTGRIIFATHDNSKKGQAFDIYRVTVPHGSGSDYVTVFARHVSYRLSHVIAQAGGVVGEGPAEYMERLNHGVEDTNPAGLVYGTRQFSFYSDVNKSQWTQQWQLSYITKTNRDIRTILLDSKTGLLSERTYDGQPAHSMQDQGFGHCGDFEFDNFNVRLLAQRGKNLGVKMRTGKNVRTLNVDYVMDDVVTACIPFWRGRHPISGEEKYVDLYNLGFVPSGTRTSYRNGIVYSNTVYPYQRTVQLDLSSVWEQPPTAEEMYDTAVEYLVNHQYNLDVNYKSYAVDLVNMSDNVVEMQSADLCDYVTVQDVLLGEDALLQVSSVTYDSLLDRYVSMVVGSLRQTVPETIAKANDIYVRQLRNVETEVADLADKTQVVQHVAPATQSTQNNTRLLRASSPLVDANGEEIEKIATINRVDVYAHKGGGGSGGGAGVKVYNLVYNTGTKKIGTASEWSTDAQGNSTLMQSGKDLIAYSAQGMAPIVLPDEDVGSTSKTFEVFIPIQIYCDMDGASVSSPRMYLTARARVTITRTGTTDTLTRVQRIPPETGEKIAYTKIATGFPIHQYALSMLSGSSANLTTMCQLQYATWT